MSAVPPFWVLIPARLGSTRLPGKPLADIGGAPMVVRVAQRVQRSGAQGVVVACDSATIVQACAAHGVQPDDFKHFKPLAQSAPAPAAIKLVETEVQWARQLMLQGAPLVHRLPGRAGWELRLVVQGGLAILDKIAAQGFDTFSHRPTVGKADAPRLLWRAVWM